MRVRQIKRSDIPEWMIMQAAKERVSVPDSPMMVLHGAYSENEMVGFVGLLTFKHGQYGLMKSAWVAPAYRRRGIYKLLHFCRVKYAREMGLEKLITSAYFDAADLHLKNGAKILKRYKEGLKMEICIK